MKLEAVLPALRDGKKIRRASWPSDWHWSRNASAPVLTMHNGDSTPYVSSDALFADDWEVVQTPEERVCDAAIEAIEEMRNAAPRTQLYPAPKAAALASAVDALIASRKAGR